MKNNVASRQSFYDNFESLIYDDVIQYSNPGDIAFWRQLLKEYAPGGSVLELGCGTMRVGIPIAETGCCIIGVDKSPLMLARAREKILLLREQVRNRISLNKSDLLLYRSTCRFDFICMPLNVIMEMSSIDEAARALSVVYKHLKPSGHAAFEVGMLPGWACYSRFKTATQPYAEFQNKRYGMINRKACFDFDGRDSVQVQFVTRAKINSKPLTQRSTLKWKIFRDEDIRDIVTSSGLYVVDDWMGYNRSVYRPGLGPTPRILLVRKKEKDK